MLQYRVTEWTLSNGNPLYVVQQNDDDSIWIGRDTFHNKEDAIKECFNLRKNEMEKENNNKGYKVIY